MLNGTATIDSAYNHLTANLFFSGSPYAIDTDDGSDRVNCTSNVIVAQPLFKTDFSGHQKTFQNNVDLFSSCGGSQAGTRDTTNVFTGNKVRGDIHEWPGRWRGTCASSDVISPSTGCVPPPPAVRRRRNPSRVRHVRVARRDLPDHWKQPVLHGCCRNPTQNAVLCRFLRGRVASVGYPSGWRDRYCSRSSWHAVNA